MLEAENAVLLKDFVEENWPQFLEWAAERGQSEDDCEAICGQLDAVIQKL